MFCHVQMPPLEKSSHTLRPFCFDGRGRLKNAYSGLRHLKGSE